MTLCFPPLFPLPLCSRFTCCPSFPSVPNLPLGLWGCLWCPAKLAHLSCSTCTPGWRLTMPSSFQQSLSQAPRLGRMDKSSPPTSPRWLCMMACMQVSPLSCRHICSTWYSTKRWWILTTRPCSQSLITSLSTICMHCQSRYRLATPTGISQ